MSATPPQEGQRPAFRVLLVLPPDFDAPQINVKYRFPPQGPALVAASARGDGVSFSLIDLELSVEARAVTCDRSLLDTDSFHQHLRGRHVAGLEELAQGLLDRIEDNDFDAIAFSLDRHTQIRVACLLAYEAKRR
jgi:hypothetical protein